MQSSNNRIIFLDILRAAAVLMMVQGHTIDALLSPEYRTFDSVIYSMWHTVRGFTAPVFMFTAGVVFTYLLNLKNFKFEENPRVKKGFKRFLLLLSLGYLLRYPTYKIIDFSNVSENQWRIFFTVDALHLIAFGILFILIISFITEKIKLNKLFAFSAVAFFFFMMVYPASLISWGEILPQYIAGYFTRQFGSIFPLFPYAGYVLAGGVMGFYLAKNKDVFRSKNFHFKILLLGVSAIGFSYLAFEIIKIFEPGNEYWTSRTTLIFFRLGVVLILNGIVGLAVAKLNNIPSTIKLIGRHTLLIYAVHLVIIYGSAWSPGLSRYFYRTFSLEQALIAAVTMICLMIGLILFLNKFVFELKKRKVKFAIANVLSIKIK